MALYGGYLCFSVFLSCRDVLLIGLGNEVWPLLWLPFVFLLPFDCLRSVKASVDSGEYVSFLCLLAVEVWIVDFGRGFRIVHVYEDVCDLLNDWNSAFSDFCCGSSDMVVAHSGGSGCLRFFVLFWTGIPVGVGGEDWHL